MSRVVRYFPLGPIARFAVPPVFILGGAGLFVVFVLALQTVRLQCDRSSASCTILGSWFGVFDERESLDLRSIKGTRLQVSHGKHGSSYQVVLETAVGDKRISAHASSDGDERAQQKKLIDAFLKDRSQRDLDVLYDDVSPGSALLCLGCSLMFLWAGSVLSRWARVEVDRSRRVLTVSISRWPLLPLRTVYPLDRVRGATVSEGRDGKGSVTYATALVLDGEEVPALLLPVGASSDRVTAGRAAARIVELLERAPDRGG